MKRVLFLDIDGVMNSERLQRAGWNRRFDPVALALLQRLIELSGCEVVWSTSWRGPNFQIMFPERVKQTPGADHEFWRRVARGKYTPEIHLADRGREIEAFVRGTAYEINDVVIIDDDRCMEPYMQRLVNTSFDDGFQLAHFKKAMALWGLDPNPIHREMR